MYGIPTRVYLFIFFLLKLSSLLFVLRARLKSYIFYGLNSVTHSMSKFNIIDFFSSYPLTINGASINKLIYFSKYYNIQDDVFLAYVGPKMFYALYDSPFVVNYCYIHVGLFIVYTK